MPARTSNVAAAIYAPGVEIQIVDAYWTKGERLREYESDFIFRYRESPKKVTVAANLGTKIQHFGQLMLFPPNVELQTTPARLREQARIIDCRFQHHWFSRLWPSAASWHPEQLAQCFDIQNDKIEQAIRRLSFEALTPGFASNILIEALATMIVIEGARYFNVDEDFPRMKTQRGILAARDLRRICDYIEGAQRSPTASEIAEDCGMTARNLNRVFKNTTGKTIQKYVEEVRLEKAKRLLCHTALPLKQIAHDLGFADVSSFSTAFKRATGEAPGQARYRMRC